MDELEHLKIKFFKIEKECSIYNNTFNILKKHIKSNNSFKDVYRYQCDKFNIFTVINNFKDKINSVTKFIYKEKEEILQEIKKIEKDVIKRNDLSNKEESNFIFYNSVTNYGYLEYNVEEKWDLIKKIYEDYKIGFYNNTLNLNIRLLDPSVYYYKIDNLESCIGEYTNSEILYNIIELLNSIDNDVFFNIVKVIKNEFISDNKDNFTLVEPIPNYFYENIVYNGIVFLKIDGTIYKFNNPTLNDIKPYIISYNSFDIKIVK